MEKEALLHEFVAAYDRLIEAARLAAQRGDAPQDHGWGPREVVAHLAGWELMATVRIPHIVAGMAPPEFTDETQARVMNDAINTATVTLAGDQPLETLCGALRRAYLRTVEILTPLGERHFQPGEYVYERTKAVIDHCQEHIDVHLSPGAGWRPVSKALPMDR
jgi:hypothetical protein